MVGFAIDPKIDPVGVCMGIEGIRMKAIAKTLGKEKLDVVRWSDSLETFISQLFAPALIQKLDLDLSARCATLHMRKDHYFPANGRKGERVRLISQLLGLKLELINLSP